MILQRPLVKQIAFAMRRLMVLQRVIREMLLAFGEHHAVDLHVSIFAGEQHVLIHFRQAAAKCADGPLQLAGSFDACFLVGEVPDAGAPVLQVHVTELGACADDQFDRTAVQT